tara:strand:+ start:475 stop:714 length:240 start_codon:yes stop_codon:yes gene_type:complete
LLEIACKYWIIEIEPNLELILVIPIMIFSSFSSLINGKWYKPASGLLELLRNIKIVANNEIKIRALKFILLNIFLKEFL